MKKTLLILLLSLFSLSFNAFANASLDKIVAVVNDDVVTQSEFNKALTLAKTQFIQENKSTPPTAVLEKKVLDSLINKKIQLQIAKQVGISVTDTDLDNTIANIAKQNNITVAELNARVKSEGFILRDYREELRDQITIQKLQRQEVVSHITVSANEINNFLNSQAWASNSSKEYHLEDILVPVSDTPSTDELRIAKKHANALLEKLNKGENFKKLAQRESASNALDGGDLGWRSVAEIPSAFAEKVTQMQKEAIAGPIQTPNGFHIIRLVDVRSSGSDDKKPDRKQVENLLLQRKFEEAVQNWTSRIRSQAFIDVKSVPA